MLSRKLHSVAVYTVTALFVWFTIFNSFPVNNIFANQNTPMLLPNSASLYTHAGVGAEWNVTHYANTTVTNQISSFTNGSYSPQTVPLGIGWTGYNLNSSVSEIYDIQNRCNGTFDFGPDNGYLTPWANDSNTVPYIQYNPYQGWIFGGWDRPTYTNPLRGNYNESAHSTNGVGSLELCINGSWTGTGYRYDLYDVCHWRTFFNIQSAVLDSELQFDVCPSHVMNLETFQLVVSINDKRIYTIGMGSLFALIGCSQIAPAWGTIRLPQVFWGNNSNIFSEIGGSTFVFLNISLINSFGITYPTNLNYNDYQQLWISNVKLITKGIANASQVQLKMNSTEVSDIDGAPGKGMAGIAGAWQGTEVITNFSTNYAGDLGDFSSTYFGISNASVQVWLTSTLTLSARKEATTFSQTKFDSQGTSFSVTNGSQASWACYVYCAVPTGYTENLMMLNFPEDVAVTWINEPQDTNQNRLSSCNNATPGILVVPTDAISLTPDGFWYIEANSPNYCIQLTLLEYTSGWKPALDNTFVTGDFVKVTGNIINSAIVSPYIWQTSATLLILYPNGTTLSSLTQVATVDAQGNLSFAAFQIPTESPSTSEGVYQIIILWNDAHMGWEAKEAGAICVSFMIQTPEDYSWIIILVIATIAAGIAVTTYYIRKVRKTRSLKMRVARAGEVPAPPASSSHPSVPP